MGVGYGGVSVGVADLSDLGLEAGRLARAIAVIGHEAPLWLVAEAAGLDRDEAAVAADALVAAGHLTTADPVSPAPGMPMDEIAGSEDSATRHALHRRIAHAWSTTAAGTEPAVAHLLAAPPGGEDWAAPFLLEASRSATADGRHEDAVARLERAAVEPGPPALQVELLTELGDARERAGQPGVEPVYRQALAMSVDGARPGIHLRLGRHLYGAGDYRAAALELDRGLEVVESHDDPEAVELVAAYVAAARFDMTLSEAAARHLAPILERPGVAHNPAERALLAEVALEKGIQGRTRTEVVDLALRAWADGLLLQGADPYGIQVSQVAASLTWSDAFEQSDAMLTATADHADREGEAQLLGTALYLRAWPRYYAGRLAESEADVRAALATDGWEMYQPSARAILAHTLIERGAFDEALRALELVDPEPWVKTVPYAMLLEARARIHIANGDLDAAASDLEGAGELMIAMGATQPFCPWRARLGFVRARQGDVAGGLDQIEVGLEQARSADVPRPLGIALHARGLVARLDGGDGMADLQAAVEALEGIGARVDHARVLVDMGAALVADERRDDARGPLHQGGDLARRIGADEVAERADYHLRRAGGRPSRDTVDRPGGLTDSELRVARLAARGLTNAQIASELVVTPHTVRFHLGRAYRKLDVSGRDQLPGALDARP